MKAPIGARVSIRFHDPEGGFRDLVGHLESENSLRNRHGELIEFDVNKIALYKIIEEKRKAKLELRNEARKKLRERNAEKKRLKNKEKNN